jgi:hypothetical protein
MMLVCCSQTGGRDGDGLDSHLTDRNDMSLWASSVMLDDALARADNWDQRSEAERLDFFLEWEEMMDRLVGVATDGSAGRLSDQQVVQLESLAARLAASRPTIERLGLDYPDLGRLSLES